MDISESVEALLSSKALVIEHLYDRLFESRPDLRQHFENRDMRIQASMLTVALASVEAYYSQRFPATGHYLKVLGNRHFHEGVRTEDYAAFREALIGTLQEFFAETWDQPLANQWHEALDLAIETMMEGYEI
ncbi:MAG: hypothetical protein KDA86_28015 [Planctomycetaceae bacterium]|nr:hypothetical protein [Planctomycetaceae bacterium]MCA9075794.1 hypothetical protein [Planctomycetaceae bacterium]